MDGVRPRGDELGAVLARERAAHGEDDVDPERARRVADLAMEARRLAAELGHLADHRHGSLPAGPLDEVLERRPHRDRIAVVGIDYDEATPGLLRLLPPPAGEANVARALARALEREPERPVGR